ncbi:MAG: DUF2520 domain-containing protein [Gemmatimonadota bacterium]|nr:DUF2520 domain-containing protein [Gemmatimonadota bacterium]
MTPSPPERERLWIVGPGRMGLAFGLLLRAAGALESLTYTGGRSAPPSHPLLAGAAPFARLLAAGHPPEEGTTGILLAVPDAALTPAAEALAASGVPRGVPVLHLSGSRGAEALSALAESGTPVGSLHPLAAVADPVSGAERLRGAAYGVEGEGAARVFALRLVTAAGGVALPMEAGGKPLYHAAAVFASNYVVTLLALAERFMERAGIPAAEGRSALASLAAGAVENVREWGPAGALTGPVLRGERETILLHLSRLSGEESALYSLLGRETLALARQQGLDGEAAASLGAILGEKA